MKMSLRQWLVVIVAAAVVQAQVTNSPPRPDWKKPKQFTVLAAHPRLFVSSEQIERMVAGRGDTFARACEQVATVADAALGDVEQPMQEISPFERGFLIQGRLTSLAIQWHRTRDRRYLEAALKTVQAMRSWLEPLREFSLQHGQYIAGIAVAYDLLYNDLTVEERAAVVALAREHCIRPFLRLTGKGRNLPTDGERGSWWQEIVSNWNAVCNSGPGLLALTMYEDLDEAQTVLDRVDASFKPIFDYLQQTEGGWVEGLGYWNWTIHYLSLFYMSYERATGLKHEGFRSPGFRQSLTFGTYFVPYDEACGFGDNQHGNISSSLLAAAEHLGDKAALKTLQDYQDRYRAARKSKADRRTPQPGAVSVKAPKSDATAGNIGYGVPQDLLILPDPLTDVPSAPAVTNMVRYFPKQGWAMIADRWPQPTIYAAIRGGELGGPHTHDDLLSWHGVVGTERMISTLTKAGYYASAWAGRAREINERNSASKNTLFIAGLSAYSEYNERRGGYAQASATSFLLPTGVALRLDATRAFYLTRASPRLVTRLFAVLGDKGLLVLDRMVAPARHPVEVRTYTEKPARFGERDVLLEGECEVARMTFAADRPARLRHAVALLTDARAEPPTMMRWQTLDPEASVTLASLLTRGREPVDLKVKSDATTVVVTVTGKGWRQRVELTDKLLPVATP